MKRFVLLALVLAAGCESDVDRASRLRTQKVLACEEEELARIQIEDGQSPTIQPTDAQRAKCMVATRELNKFMEGR